MQSVPIITTEVVSSNLDQGEVYNSMWSSLSVTCDQVGGFPPGPPVSSTNKTDRHDITEILLKDGAKHHQTILPSNWPEIIIKFLA